MIFNGHHVTLDGRTLDNAGTATWAYDEASQPSIYLTNGAVFNNLAGAVFTREDTTQYGAYIQGDYGAPNAAQFNNAGTLAINVGADDISTSFNYLLFNNAGTVNVQRGILQLQDGASNGVIDINSSTIVTIKGSFENQTNGNIRGSGTLDVSGGNFTNNGTIEPTVTVIN